MSITTTAKNFRQSVITNLQPGKRGVFRNPGTGSTTKDEYRKNNTMATSAQTVQKTTKPLAIPNPIENNKNNYAQHNTNATTANLQAKAAGSPSSGNNAFAPVAQSNPIKPTIGNNPSNDPGNKRNINPYETKSDRDIQAFNNSPIGKTFGKAFKMFGMDSQEEKGIGTGVNTVAMFQDMKVEKKGKATEVK